MKKLFASLMMATLLVPTGALASSIRPGSHGTIKPRTPKGPSCLIENKWKSCEITIDETGVEGPVGHIANVVQWNTEEKDFNVAGGIVGGAAGAGVGFAAGLGSCAVLGPFCLITAPAIMNTGMMVGGGAGGKGTGKFFTVIGDDAQGQRLIQEWYESSGKAARKVSKELLNTTKLVEGETR
jgi:hypothetical protein